MRQRKASDSKHKYIEGEKEAVEKLLTGNGGDWQIEGRGEKEE